MPAIEGRAAMFEELLSDGRGGWDIFRHPLARRHQFLSGQERPSA
jgi:hypothetical protein